MWKFWEKKQPPVDLAYRRAMRFEQVERMIGGLPVRRQHPSLLFFTVHKAASSYVGSLLIEAAERHGIVNIDYMEYLNSEATSLKHCGSYSILELVLGNLDAQQALQNSPVIERLPYELPRLFPSQGFEFGPIRYPYPLKHIPHLQDYKILVQLRDPRDCLTSMYFSQAFSHVPPGDPEKQKSFFEARQRLQESNIDEYALKAAPKWLALFESYADAFQKWPHMRFVKYEQMVLDFPGWLSEVEKAWGIEFERGFRSRLIDKSDFTVKQEDIYSHKRQVLPGDHVRKLKPETVRQLTDLFGPMLDTLGYSRTAESARAA